MVSLSECHPFQGRAVRLQPVGARGSVRLPPGIQSPVRHFDSGGDPEIVRDGRETLFPLLGGRSRARGGGFGGGQGGTRTIKPSRSAGLTGHFLKWTRAGRKSFTVHFVTIRRTRALVGVQTASARQCKMLKPAAGPKQVPGRSNQVPADLTHGTVVAPGL